MFTTIGHIEPTIKIIAALVQASGEYTLTLTSGDTVLASQTRSGNGGYEHVILKDLELLIPHVFRMDISNGQLIELNLATLCLCEC